MKRKVILQLIEAERKFQEAKWGTAEEQKHTPGNYLLIIEKELEEAKLGWLKRKSGRDSYPSELIQLAAVCVAALEDCNPVDGTGNVELLKQELIGEIPS